MFPRPRILHLRASRFVGGPEQQILRYASYLEPGVADSVIATFIGDGEGTALLEEAQKRGLDTLSLPGGSFSALHALIAGLRAKPCALICTHGYKADILGIVAGKLTGTPVASFLRGWTGEDAKVHLYESLNRSLLSFTDRVVCLSNAQRIASDKSGHLGKTRVVMNAIEVPSSSNREAAAADLRKRFNLPVDAVLIASAGRLSPEKGTAVFIDAAKVVADGSPRAHFLIFGDGTQRHTLELQTSGISNIHFAGHVNDFRTLVSGLDILVNPSFAEEMPNVVLEAMAAAVPVIATAVGAVAEIAGERALLLIAPGDSASMAKAMQQFLADPASAREFGLRGQQRVASEYSPAKQKEQLTQLFAEFVSDLTPAVSPPQYPFISVVVPVRNEELHISTVLSALAGQDYPSDRFEVLVADGNSTDRTCQIVEEFAATARMRVRVVPNPQRLSSAGRNAGALASQGEIIAFVDGHCLIPTPRLLKNITGIFDHSGAACLCRPQPLHVPGNSRFQDAVANTRATVLGHGRDSTIFDMAQEREVDPSSSGAIYKAEVFERIGMFDETFDACEDVEFNFRVRKAGFKAVTSPRLSVFYSPRKNVRSLWRQLVRYGQGRFRFMRKHPDATTLAQLIPAAFVAWLAFLGMAAFVLPLAGILLLGTVFVYLLVTVLFAILLGARFGIYHLWLSPVIYACIHLGLGVGFWKEAFTGPGKGVQPVKQFSRDPGADFKFDKQVQPEFSTKR